MHWAAGDRRSAAIALGPLSTLVGDAAELAPAELRGELPAWATALAEGRARGDRPRA